ncbi:MAG: DUF3987 domain-containing protein [Acidovorax sp.]|nr:DUF3987 domain-containing protein [Acidovorax sp.]
MNNFPLNSFQYPLAPQVVPGPNPMRALTLHNALPPFMQRAAWELHTRTGVSLEAVIPLMLGIAASACQGVANVGFPDGQKSSLSLFIALVATPASGKSRVLERLLDVLYRFEDERKAELAVAGDEDTEHQILFSNMSREALPQSSGLMAEEEGEDFLMSRVGRAYSTLSKLWDGRLSRVNRVSRDRQVADRVRMGLVLTLPPGPWQAYIQKYGNRLLESGLASRLVVAEAISLPASQYTEERLRMGPEMALRDWDGHLMPLLRQSVWTSQEVGALPTLHMTEEAKRHWMQVGRHCEWLAQHGVPPQLQAHALRFPQMVGRVAAVLHLVEGYEGLLAAEMIDRARVICEYFLCEAMRMLLPPPAVPQIQLDAQAVEHELRMQPARQLGKDQLVSIAKSAGVSKARVEKALQILAAAGRVGFSTAGRASIVHLVMPPMITR